MTEPSLRAIGLRSGDRVRFRRRSGSWAEGVAVRMEKDGSVGVRDHRGAARAIRIEALEVRTTGPRGAPRWEPLADVAARTEQLDLF